MRKSRIALLCVLALAAAGCDVGNGNRPEAIRFIKSTFDTSTLESTTVYQCFTQGQLVIAEFTDGIPGDFTGRVTYRSSDETVVRVSNGDLFVPGSDRRNVYNPGALIPVGPGNARIVAEFGGLTATLPVTVRAPTSITVSNEMMTDSDGATQHPVVQMVPGTTQQLTATAVLDDGTTSRSVNVTTQGSWSSTDSATTAATDTAIARISASTGLVTAIAVPAMPSPQIASIEFAPCSGKDGAPGLPTGLNAQTLQTRYEVRAPARNLVLVTEPGYASSGGAMPTGSAQFVRVLADFDTDPGNGEGQDLSLKGASFSFNPTGVLSYSPASVLVLAGAVPTGQASNGPAVITASFGDTAPNLYTSDPISLSVLAATLDSLSISPTEAVIAPRGAQQFNATARYTVNGVASALILPANHDVFWRSNPNGVVNVSNFTTSAGLATSLQDTAASSAVSITVQSNNLIPPTVPSAVPTANATLIVGP